MFKRKRKMEEKEPIKEPENPIEGENNTNTEKSIDTTELGEKLIEMNDKYLRLYSEFDNYRKRTQKEKIDLIKFGGEEIVKSLLPIVDDLERAIGAFEEKEEPFKDGIVLIYNKLISILNQKGIKSIETKGQKFDENFHEAVSQIPATGEDDKNKIIDDIEKGYTYHEKVIRYAKVIVAI